MEYEGETLDQGILDAEFIDFNEKYSHLLREGYSFEMGTYISKAIFVFKQYAGQFIGYTAIIVLGFLLVEFIPVIGPIAVLIFSPVLNAGYYIVAQKIYKGKPYEFNDFFKGFEYFGHIVPAYLLVKLFAVIGFILLIFPCIYISVAYSWVVIIILFHSSEFWYSMEQSRQLVTKKWFHFFLFIIVLGLINLLGLLVLGIGFLFTFPVTQIAMYVAFEEIVGTN